MFGRAALCFMSCSVDDYLLTTIIFHRSSKRSTVSLVWLCSLAIGLTCRDPTRGNIHPSFLPFSGPETPYFFDAHCGSRSPGHNC